MSWDNYKPTAGERRAIASAWALIEEKCGRYPNEVNRHLREEIKGCGFHSDRIPRHAAQGLMIKWFLQGVKNPNMLARDMRGCRPASQFMNMEGAHAHGPNRACALSLDERTTLENAVDAHEACFARHLKKQKEKTP